MSMIPAIWEVEAEDHKFEANPGKVSKTLSQKKKKKYRSSQSVAQVVDRLPSMLKALCSVPSIAKQRE
jgi:hypothetical protein